MRVAIGGFHHETNTFAPAVGDLKAFQSKDHMGIVRGPGLLRNLDANQGFAGFAKEALSYGWALAPLTMAGAPPSDKVTVEAFETILGMILEDLRAALPVDAVFLDLHGAMVAEHHDSGDEEILRRVRALIGPNIPLLVEFDFHANITADTVRLADAIFVYRTYPHVDMAAMGAKAARHLKAMREGLPRQAKAMREIDYLIPVNAQSTLVEPMKSVVAMLEPLEGQVIGNGRVSTVSVAACFPLADVPNCRPTVLAYADSQGAADAAADRLAEAFRDMEPLAVLDLLEARDGVAQALEIAQGGGTAVLADTQDNPGGGGNGDTVGLLNALLDAQVPRALLAHIWDPETAALTHKAGVGAVLDIGVGAKTGWAGEVPVQRAWTVEQLNDGRTEGTGPMAKGWKFRMGQCARLRHGGVTVLVVSGKGQCLDQEQIKVFGIDPFDFPVLALKSSVHFRADFGPQAKAILVVTAPGPVARDPRTRPYRNLKRGLRTVPMGEGFAG